MRTRPLLAAAVLAAVVPLLPALAAEPVGPGDRLSGKAVEAVAATCRRDPASVGLGQGESCAALPGAPAEDVAAYEASEVHRALALQSRLGDPLPLRTSSWVGTHNSFNSTSERPTLSHSDSNQQLSLTDQLRLDVRSLELDVHWWPSLAAAGAKGPVVCHGESAHEGCTTERSLRERLGEVRTWMDAHPTEVVFLYLEDHLDEAAGYDAAAQVVQDVLGDRLYRPADRGATGCTPLPPTLSRDEVRAAGRQAFVMSGCGQGTAWAGQVFQYSPKTEERPSGLTFPSCQGYDPAASDPVFLRFYEDSTFVTSAASVAGQATADDGLTPATTRAAVRCGVDLLGFDQLLPGDGRLAALVWSFALGQLDAPDGSCASLRAEDGLWAAGGCDGARPAACRAPDGSWLLTAPTPRAGAAGRCTALGAAFATPRRGREAELLREAADGRQAWLPLVRAAGAWT